MTDQSKEPQEKEESRIETSLLGERGAMLPVGIHDGAGNYHKDFTARRWRVKEERELGALVESQQSTRFGQYVELVLAYMCPKIGPHDFSSSLMLGNSGVNKKAMIERQAIINSMYVADVLHAYVYLRVMAKGPKFLIDLPCPRCREMVPIYADLNTVEVRSVDRVEDAEWTFTLHDPFEIRGSEATKLIIRPPLWSALSSFGSQGQGRNFGELKATVIHGSVYTVAGKDPVPLTDHELDEMSKWDLEDLTAAIDERALGPDLSVEANCPSCRRSMETSIEWESEDFFGSSSRANR